MVPRPLDGLGDGPHRIEIQSHRSHLSLRLCLSLHRLTGLMLHESMLYLSSGDGRREPDHRRAGRGRRHDHPAHPVATRPSACCPTPSCGAAPASTAPGTTDRLVGHPAAPGQGFSLESLAPALRALDAGQSLAAVLGLPEARGGRRAGTSPPRTPARTVAELYGFAELQPGAEPGPGARRCSRSCPPPCGTRARPRRRTGTPAGRPRRAVLGRVAPVPDPPPSPWCTGTRRRNAGPSVAVTTRHGGVSTAPYDTLNLGLHVGDRPGDVVDQPRPGGRGLRRRPRRHGLRPAGPRPDGRARRPRGPGPRHRVRGRRRPRHRHPRDRRRPASPRRSWWPTASRIALVDPAARVLAAVHAGWRGTAAGAVGRALQAMEHGGARPERVMAFLGSGRPSRPLPGLRRGAAALSDAVRPARARRRRGPARRARPLAGRPGRGQPPAARRPAASDPSTSPSAAPPRPTRPSSATAPQRPCGRFALLARLAD